MSSANKNRSSFSKVKRYKKIIMNKINQKLSSIVDAQSENVVLNKK